MYKKGNKESFIYYKSPKEDAEPTGNIKINLRGKLVASYNKDWERTELEWRE